jgi:hypothetical protein
MIQKAVGRDAYLGFFASETLQDLPAEPGYEWVLLEEIPENWERDVLQSVAEQLDEFFEAQPEGIRMAFADEWVFCSVLLQNNKMAQVRQRIQNKVIPPELSDYSEELEAFRSMLLSLIPE